jgi:hypothetical protein
MIWLYTKKTARTNALNVMLALIVALKALSKKADSQATETKWISK